MNEEAKKEIEKICDEFLRNFANEHDRELSDGGGFANKENFYDWDKDIFVINFLSISQDDFLNKFSLFEKLGLELRTKIEEKTKINDLTYEGDCPIIYIKF